MSSTQQKQTAQTPARERTDLCGQYRPIGIGAVAAALLAAGRRPAAETRSAANCNAEPGRGESLAA